jgi:hypothetical protein
MIEVVGALHYFNGFSDDAGMVRRIIASAPVLLKSLVCSD